MIMETSARAFSFGCDREREKRPMRRSWKKRCEQTLLILTNFLGGGYDKSDFHAMMDDRWMEDDMELKIEHLQKHFEKKTVLRDINFFIFTGKDLWIIREKRRRQDDAVQLSESGSADRQRSFLSGERGWERVPVRCGSHWVCAVHAAGAGISDCP